MPTFSWTPKKAAANLRKHGVSFETAKEVFIDDARIDELDDEPSEERWRVIGRAAGKILFVVYTEDSGIDAVHIISAREATRREQERYLDQTSP